MRKRRSPLLAVDAVILSPDYSRILLIRRLNDPFKNYYALPGGFVEWGETTEEACLREALEETSLNVEILDLVGVFSDPKRDPRGHVVSVAYLCRAKSYNAKASSDAKEVAWIEIHKILKGDVKLAFDHLEIIREAVKKLEEIMGVRRDDKESSNSSTNSDKSASSEEEKG
ncbi:MAG: NUDIX domain-containing protein [Candidatus Njordarchaeales archaeon]